VEPRQGPGRPWWAENSKEAYNSGLDGLAKALKNFSDSKHGRRKGRQMGFPRRRKKRHARVACRFTTGQIKVLSDRKHVQLPRIGVLKTHESTRKLARRLEQGSARILAATIARTADRWFVSFTCEVQRTIPADNGKPGVVGVDVGVRHLAVLSTGMVAPNPRALECSLRKLRRLNRQLARRQPDSQRRKSTRRRLARAQARAANIRRDALHKLTTTLATEHGTVVVEQLNVAGMLRNRRLARAVADAGFGEVRRLLAYKTAWCGSRLVVADPFYPSSKICSACGWVKAKLTLAERTFQCEACGLVLDRDLNAARNPRQARAARRPEWPGDSKRLREGLSAHHYGGRSGNPGTRRTASGGSRKPAARPGVRLASSAGNGRLPQERMFRER
jgi:IS605 OrfB family transposase